MSSYRKERINDAVAQELSIALRAARDPVLASAFVSRKFRVCVTNELVDCLKRYQLKYTIS